MLRFESKHPVRGIFNEVHFREEIDIFLYDLKLKRIPGEKLRDIEAAAKKYATKKKQTPSDKVVEEATKYLKDNGLLAVPFDNGVGFCVMKNETYEKKLKNLFQAEQFSERKNLTDNLIKNTEEDISKELLALIIRTRLAKS